MSYGWDSPVKELIVAGNAQLVQQTDEYLMPNYGRVPLAMVKGSGARIWDADGKEYIDFFAGFGAGGVVGHLSLIHI